MTATLLDRDAHAGAAADARRPATPLRSLCIWGVRPEDPAVVQEAEAMAAWLLACAETPGTPAATAAAFAHGAHLLCKHARDLAGVATALDAADVAGIVERPGFRDRFDGEIAPPARVAQLAEDVHALRAQNARLLSQTPYSEDHRAALLAVYAKRAPVAQERAA